MELTTLSDSVLYTEYWFPRPINPMKNPLVVILGGARQATTPPMEVYVDDDTTCHPKVGETLRAFLPTVFSLNVDVSLRWNGYMRMRILVWGLRRNPFGCILDGHHGLYYVPGRLYIFH
ncbi:hypothetical protein EV363DRAFT_1304584 [Boletus edulis]|nr:hypothetical protein EV363DRAFT_1304584 [Boletus edulis]